MQFGEGADMYRIDRQIRIEDFVFPYGQLDKNNEWIKLADITPWEVAEEMYAKQFVNNGHPAHPARIALGALIIKQRLNCSDEWVVRHVSENPYLQFFLGLKEYTSKCPFGASTMVEFRKRFPPETIAALLSASAEEEKKEDANDPPEGDTNENSGTLIMDATCCPADISYPQDFRLLNEGREKLEGIVDEYCKTYKLKKPRMRRRCARRDFLNLSKCKKRTTKKLRKGIRQQLQYIYRDIGFIVSIIQENHIKVSEKYRNLLNTITTLYEQQLYMLENKVHSVEDRIVSISQPWVRPIVRGKAHANTEFGAKLHISMVNGYAKIERLSFDAYNEASDFFKAVGAYRDTHGCYPRRILADKIYRNRETIAWCKERKIQLTGPALGRPPKNKETSKQAKKQEYQDICDRNIVEGAFGVGKRSYGLNRIMAHLQETSFCVIGIALLCMNLAKRLRPLLLSFFRCRLSPFGCSVNRF